MKKSLLLIIAVIALIATSCKEEGKNPECYIHYTPEQLDPKTEAVINAFKNNQMFPSTQEGMDSIVNMLAALSYEQYAALHPKFSDEYQLDSIIDENGFKTLILKYNGVRENNMPEANLIYNHGGGFMINMSNSHRDICQRLAKQMNFTVYIPLYPLAPNYYVQTTLDMLTNIYKQVITDGKPIYIMGDSAGGNVTLSFSLYLKSLGMKLPNAMFPISPCCEFSGANPQLPEYNKKDIMSTLALNNEAYKHWRPEDMPVSDPRVSPQYGDWKGMPQAFIFAATDETFYPEIMETAENMKNAGMRVGILIGNGLFHTAPCFPIPVMDQYFDEITEFLYGNK